MTKKHAFYSASLTFQQICVLWQDFVLSPIKNRLKSAANMANQISHINDLDILTTDQFNELILMLRSCGKLMFGYRSANKIIADLTIKYMRFKGIPEPNIISKKRKTMSTDGAYFIVADATAQFNSYDEAVQKIKQGEALLFETGCDGNYSIQLFYVDIPEPIIPTKIFKSIVHCSDVFIIQCPSGELGVFAHDGPELKLKLEPGNYKIAIYSKYEQTCAEGFYIVIAKTEMSAVNQCKEVPIM